MEDSNLRRLSQQIYSLPHLTALETPRYEMSIYVIQKKKKVDKWVSVFSHFAAEMPSTAHEIITARRLAMAEPTCTIEATKSETSAPAML